MVYGQFLSNLGPLTLTADEISVSVPVRLMQKASACSDLQRQRQTYCNTKQGPLYSCPSVLPAINHQDEPHACWRQAGTHKEETFSAQTKQICCDQLDGSRVRKLAAQWMWRMSYQFVCFTWKQHVLQPNDRQVGNSLNTRALRGGKKSSMAQKWSQVPVHRFQFCCAALYLLRQLAPSIKGDTVKRLQISWPPAPSPHFPHSPALLCGPSRNGEGMGKHWQQLLTAARAVYQQNPIYTTWNMCILFQVVVKHRHYLSSRNIPVSFKYLFSHLSFCNYWLRRQGGSS